MNSVLTASSLIQSFHVGESELLSFGRQAIASAGLFSCGYKCLSVAIPYEQELGWRSDSRITSFFSHFFGAIPLWSSGVWCHWEGWVQTQFFFPFCGWSAGFPPCTCDFLLILEVQELHSCVSQELAWSGTQWASDIDIQAFLCFSSVYGVSPCWLSVLCPALLAFLWEPWSPCVSSRGVIFFPQVLSSHCTDSLFRVAFPSATVFFPPLCLSLALMAFFFSSCCPIWLPISFLGRLNCVVYSFCGFCSRCVSRVCLSFAAFIPFLLCCFTLLLLHKCHHGIFCLFFGLCMGPVLAAKKSVFKSSSTPPFSSEKHSSPEPLNSRLAIWTRGGGGGRGRSEVKPPRSAFHTVDPSALGWLYPGQERAFPRVSPFPLQADLEGYSRFGLHCWIRHSQCWRVWLPSSCLSPLHTSGAAETSASPPRFCFWKRDHAVCPQLVLPPVRLCFSQFRHDWHPVSNCGLLDKCANLLRWVLNLVVRHSPGVLSVGWWLLLVSPWTASPSASGCVCVCCRAGTLI